MNPPADDLTRMRDAIAVLRTALSLGDAPHPSATTPAAVAAMAAAVPLLQTLRAERPR
ncbi:hypothetical protein [Spirilliplanes yamanashiensis]|uniref:Uncharacterized protein n=1 Tax=Spirilliplanes yamanashiensis TaxID=42233 RepID=A0A8J4DJN0_9ACTN|nr:hypothetical protein [Spirilliplanes yamanashiensis]MDP9816942.1 hypothetical protein [Spirilliplanes yamanashiensis]GIJ03403.1 hypothetical protein Sya03_27550 [Spirilliplanes yamanashiensis]